MTPEAKIILLKQKRRNLDINIKKLNELLIPNKTVEPEINPMLEFVFNIATPPTNKSEWV